MITKISSKDIEQTLTFSKLEPFQKSLVIKRNNREILEEALIYHRVNGQIPAHIKGNNFKILTEIIKKMNNNQQNKIDFSELYHNENNPESQEQFNINKKQFSNQCKIVYEALLRGERLTTTKALIQYGIGDLRRRIKDLKDIWDIPVKDEYVKGKFKEYYLNN